MSVLSRDIFQEVDIPNCLFTENRFLKGTNYKAASGASTGENHLDPILEELTGQYHPHCWKACYNLELGIPAKNINVLRSQNQFAKMRLRLKV